MSISHYENFPVASWLSPPRLRPAIVALYRYARTADDLADEGDVAIPQRLADLRAFRADLQALEQSREPSSRWLGVFKPLAPLLHGAQDAATHGRPFPTTLLHALLDAFEEDVRHTPYQNEADVRAYCARSAQPIGRLLLHLYGVDSPRALAQSDAICTALQLINFWQDLSVDGPRGRCYLAAEHLGSSNVTQADLMACRDSPAARAVIAARCRDAEALMRDGAPLALSLPGRIGWELRLVVQGGLRILETIRRMDHAVLRQRPTLGLLDAPSMLWRAAWMRA